MSTFFHRPRKSYYSRVFIPKNLLPFFNGRIECWKALRTPDLFTAKLRSSAWEAQGRRLFRTLGDRGPTMTTAQIDQTSEVLWGSWGSSQLMTTAYIPEPSTGGLALFAGLGVARRRRR